MKAEIGTEEIVVPDTVEELLGDEDVRPDTPWIVIVWNDPVNLMSYVVFVFQKLFGYSRKKATKLMRQVHEEGKAFEVVKMALVASVRGYAPPVAIEFARKLLFAEVRPKFADLENHLKGRKKEAVAA